MMDKIKRKSEGALKSRQSKSTATATATAPSITPNSPKAAGKPLAYGAATWQHIELTLTDSPMRERAPTRGSPPTTSTHDWTPGRFGRFPF